MPVSKLKLCIFDKVNHIKGAQLQNQILSYYDLPSDYYQKAVHTPLRGVMLLYTNFTPNSLFFQNKITSLAWRNEFG